MLPQVQGQPRPYSELGEEGGWMDDILVSSLFLY